MKTAKCLIVLLFFVGLSSSSAAFSDEAVNGYYDSENDWFVFEWNNPENGKQQAIHDSANKIKPAINASVSFDGSSGSYTYSFAVKNLSGAKQLLDHIFVSHPAAIMDATSPEPQNEWNSGEYRNQGVWSWTKTGGGVTGIPAGQTVSGFSFRSKGLPGIVAAEFSGERRVRFSGPSPDHDTDEVLESYIRVMKRLSAQYPGNAVDSVKQKTIGPVDPPTTFDAPRAIRSLIELVKQSKAQGWIANEGSKASLLAKLNNALSKANDDKRTTKNVLNAFLKEVSAQYGKQLSSEAYALLFFNGQYIVNHL